MAYNTPGVAKPGQKLPEKPPTPTPVIAPKPPTPTPVIGPKLPTAPKK